MLRLSPDYWRLWPLIDYRLSTLLPTLATMVRRLSRLCRDFPTMASDSVPTFGRLLHPCCFSRGVLRTSDQRQAVKETCCRALRRHRCGRAWAYRSAQSVQGGRDSYHFDGNGNAATRTVIAACALRFDFRAFCAPRVYGYAETKNALKTQNKRQLQSGRVRV